MEGAVQCSFFWPELDKMLGQVHCRNFIRKLNGIVCSKKNDVSLKVVHFEQLDQSIQWLSDLDPVVVDL